MDNIAETNGIQISYYNRENILRIFKLIDNVTHQPGENTIKKYNKPKPKKKRLSDVIKFPEINLI